MLSIGWPEMMIVAAAALIIVGPRDLPAMLRTVGKLAGQARRMGNEFRRELNKVAAVDDVTNIKKSITQPLKDVRSDIDSEFNKITDKGVEPSGVLKPKDPNAESVYDEIKSASEKKETSLEAGKKSMSAAFAAAEERRKALAETQQIKVPPEQADAEVKPAEKPAAKKPATKKPATRKAATKKPAAKKTATRKPAAKKNATKSAAAKPATRKTTAAKKPAQRKTAAKSTASKPKPSASNSEKA